MTDTEWPERPFSEVRQPRGPLARVRAYLAGSEWPLTVIFTGFPLWWLLGVIQLVIPVCVAVMALRLVRLRRLRPPRGFGWWSLFLVMVVTSAATISVDAPGSVPGDSGRYFSWIVRLIWFVEITVAVLYIADRRRRIAPLMLVRALALMFVWVIVGGLAGTFLPFRDFSSALDIVLPGQLRSSDFLVSLIHPVLAEGHEVSGSVSYRPSAPFRYANEWGLACAMFAPFFVLAWCNRDAGWRRRMAPLVLAIALVPIISSLNRGLWAVLVVEGVFLALKHGVHRRPRLLAGLAVLGACLVSVAALSPLSSTIENRFTSDTNSNEGRFELSSMTVSATLKASPIVGFGTTRDVQGSFYSIAGGSTTSCPHCTPPAFGTQGFLWLLLYGTGIAGAVACLGFVVGALWRARRRRDPIAIACTAAVIAFVGTLPIYDWSITCGLALMASIALLERTGFRRGTEHASIGWAVRSNVALIVACSLLGLAGGVVWQAQRPPSFEASADVLLPEPATRTASDGARQATLDTEAAFVLAPAVSASVPHGELHDLSVTAYPNTRVLRIGYTSSDPEGARSVVSTIARALVADRRQRLADQRDQALTADRAQLHGVAEAIRTSLRGARSGPGGAAAAAMRLRTSELRNAARSIQDAMVNDILSPLDPQVVAVDLQPKRHRWNIAAASGLTLGLFASIGLVRLRAVTRQRKRRRH